MARLTQCIFCVDMDSFFASVEQHLHPELKGLPVIVGGLPEMPRSVVATASYEARRFGVHSSLPSSVAKRLCPRGVFIKPNMTLYQKTSQKIMKILQEFSPFVTQMSIDEAFIDMTGTKNSQGEPKDIAKRLKQKIKDATGLTISVGIATNHFLAKIASGVNKPDGLFEVVAGQEENFVLSLPLKKMWGIGEKTLNLLEKKGLNTVALIKNCSLEVLQSIVGQAAGKYLFCAVRGQETICPTKPAKSKSISREKTFEQDLYDKNAIENELFFLCDSVMQHLMQKGLVATTVGIKIRYSDFATVTVQKAQSLSFLCTESFFEYAKGLLEKKLDKKKGLRLLGVVASDICKMSQDARLDFGDKTQKQFIIEKTIAKIKQKSPDAKICVARVL